MRNRRVTAHSRRLPSGEVRTVYHVEGVPVEDVDAVEALLDAQ
jgi:hypothetical protein